MHGCLPPACQTVICMHASAVTLTTCCRTGTRKCPRLPPSFFHAEIACSAHIPALLSGSLPVFLSEDWDLLARMSAFYLPTLFSNSDLIACITPACLSANLDWYAHTRMYVCLLSANTANVCWDLTHACWDLTHACWDLTHACWDLTHACWDLSAACMPVRHLITILGTVCMPNCMLPACSPAA